MRRSGGQSAFRDGLDGRTGAWWMRDILPGRCYLWRISIDFYIGNPLL